MQKNEIKTSVDLPVKYYKMAKDNNIALKTALIRGIREIAKEEPQENVLKRIESKLDNVLRTH